MLIDLLVMTVVRRLTPPSIEHKEEEEEKKWEVEWRRGELYGSGGGLGGERFWREVELVTKEGDNIGCHLLCPWKVSK